MRARPVSEEGIAEAEMRPLGSTGQLRTDSHFGLRVSRGLNLLAFAVSFGAIAQSLFFRVWLIGHIPINSDEGVTGLMAQTILRGHFTAFYWGQNYGGVEPYLDAVAFAVLPATGVTLHLMTAILGVIGVVLLWRCARLLLDSRPLALGVAALSLLFPTLTLLILTQAYGFRATEYALSFGLLLAALTLESDADRFWRWPLVGLLAGLGWWCSPEIIYVGVAAGLLVLGAWWRSGSWSRRGRAGALMLGGFVVGSLPWWWSSLRSDFDTLHNHGTVSSTYGERLGIFFSHVLPQLAGLQQTLTQKGIWVSTFGTSHLVAVLAICLVLAGASLAVVVTGGPRRAIGVAVLVSPFAYAASPAAWYFADGRYAVYLTPLYALVLALGLDQLVAWRRLRLDQVGRRAAASGVTVLAVVSAMLWSSWQFSSWVHAAAGVNASYFSGYSGSDAGMVPIAHALDHAGYRTGWADYWVAYRLDFLGGGSLAFSPTPAQDVRSQSILSHAMGSSDAVWLVTGPGIPKHNEPRNRNPAPGGITWGVLKRRFMAAGVSWRIDRVGATTRVQTIDGVRRVRHFGGVWVIVPNRTVLPNHVGLGVAALQE